MTVDDALTALVAAIVADDREPIRQLLDATPALATASLSVGATRQEAREFWVPEIEHYVYEGDTALHVAAAGYRVEVASELLARGAEVDARNRRKATPLHYATDGGPGSATWHPHAQRATIERLLDAGADPNVTDSNGTTPLHRAIRNRCASAVAALLERGADPTADNGRGSTPMDLAVHTTGRGGTGSAAAKAEQERIIDLLRSHPT